jgi:hypothetical protein
MGLCQDPETAPFVGFVHFVGLTHIGQERAKVLS